MKILLAIALLFPILNSYAQSEPDSSRKSVELKSEWYKKISLRGYVQVRYNGLFQTNPELECDQCDKAWGGNSGFSIRRVRLAFSGQINKRVFFYVQPDFAAGADEGTNFGQLRDAYFDVGLDKRNEYRLRFGQSKIPFGFENLQSSQNRIPLDRNDAFNSAFNNERDLGVIFYWASTKMRDRFSYLVSSGLKGSGDYGIFALGILNGQSANRKEENDTKHVVARLTYPFLLESKQIIEAGIQAYSGKSVLPSISSKVLADKNKLEYLDQRAAASLTVYPQPFGFQAEYNVGTGPEYNPATNTIDQKDLKGGYVMASWLVKTRGQTLVPFIRYQYYDGGKKFELDARSYTVKDLEVGAEYQPFSNFEVVALYNFSKRRYEDALKPVNFQQGNLLRFQFQMNF
ncbi:MAG TPA: porin [Sphingobacteriaceae bacterium]|nr:porin [Sphingobacteriaceae bacterium]